MSARHLLAPIIGTGVFMALYLALRPYGDQSGEPVAVALAFASPWWVVSHVAGILALASAARLALRLHDLCSTRLTAAGRWAGLAGLVLVLPYYGAETFALHVLGGSFLDGTSTALEVAQAIRDQPVALTMFGVGLILLAVSGLVSAAAFASTLTPGPARMAAWPLGVCIALILPQFFLPAAGRIAFGLLTLVAALLFAAVVTSLRPSTASSAAPGADHPAPRTVG